MNTMTAATTTDFYKVDHINQYPQGSNKVYSNFTPRSSRLFNGSSLYDDKVMNFGLQFTIKDYLINFWNETFFNVEKEEAIEKYFARMATSIGDVNVKQWEELHDLGYLPIIVKALPEGTRSSIKVPVFTIASTNEKFFWLTNYLETAMSTESWKSFTMATVAYEFRRVFEKYAELTGAPKEFIQFQGHDFSMRGLSCRHESYKNNIAHLTCFAGTDTIPSIDGACDKYNADSTRELVGTSVYASEHSTITMSIANYISQRSKPLMLIVSNLPETSNWKNSDWQRDIDDCIRDGIKYIVSPDGCHYEILNDGAVKDCTKLYAEKNSNMNLNSIEDRQQAEMQVLKHMITDVYPTGIYSHVSDSYDYWHTLSVTSLKLKDIINDRKVNDLGLAKLTFRPDSGDPESIICGLKIADLDERFDKLSDREKQAMNAVANTAMYFAQNEFNTSYYDGYSFKGINYGFDGIILSDESVKGSLNILWEIFGGTYNEKGFKVINPRVGLIYGDSITITRQEIILERMMEMGFSSENIIFGIGSYSYQYMTRDTLGFAMKATYGEVDGVGIEIFKDPKTDSGTKKSARGLLQVSLDEHNDYVLSDQVSIDDEDEGELKVVFNNGKLYNETSLSEIRERINNSFKK